MNTPADNTMKWFITHCRRLSRTARWPLILLGFAIALGLTGCRGPALKVEPIADSRSPQTLLRQFEKDVASARNDEVDVLAPVWFAKAESSLQAAAADQAAGRDPIEALARGRAQLLAARDASEIARAMMPKVMENRRLARQAGAVELGVEYQTVEAVFRKTARSVEAGDTGAVLRNRQSLAAAYQRLELQAIKAGALSDVRRLLLQAEREKTPQAAPQSYRKALLQLEQAERFIDNNRYSVQEIRRMADQARFYARRHLEIAAQCRDIEDKGTEELILASENRLHRIASRLNAPDLRDRSLDIQVESILGQIEAQQYERAAGIAVQKQPDQQLQSRVTDLDQRKEQQNLIQEQIRDGYRKIESIFEPHEATVDLREGQIVIRLRAIKFAVGESEILSENAALLEKVGRALSLFEDTDVIIEGHTDNVGPEAVNEALSERRAESVRHYLVMKENLPYDRMIAIGYGSTRPLTSNATVAGRAVNRRIDLIVIPHMPDR